MDDSLVCNTSDNNKIQLLQVIPSYTWILMRSCKAGLHTDIQIYGKGYPVSWCLSNKEDQILLTHYFEKDWSIISKVVYV